MIVFFWFVYYSIVSSIKNKFLIIKMSNNFDEFNYINRILRKIDEIEQNDLNKTNNNSYYINSGFIYIVDSKSGLISESISRNLFPLTKGLIPSIIHIANIIF